MRVVYVVRIVTVVTMARWQMIVVVIDGHVDSGDRGGSGGNSQVTVVMGLDG